MATEKQTVTLKTGRQADVETGQMLEQMNNLMGDVNAMLGKIRQSKSRIVAQNEAEQQFAEAEARTAAQTETQADSSEHVQMQVATNNDESVATPTDRVTEVTEAPTAVRENAEQKTETSEAQPQQQQIQPQQQQPQRPSQQPQRQPQSQQQPRQPRQPQQQGRSGDTQPYRQGERRTSQTRTDSPRSTQDDRRRPGGQQAYVGTDPRRTTRPQGGTDSRSQSQTPYRPRTQGTGGGQIPQSPKPMTKPTTQRVDPTKTAAARARADEADRRAKNKKAKLRETAPTPVWDDDTPMGTRRKARRGSVQQAPQRVEPIVIDHIVMTAERITVKDLSEKIGKPASEIIKKLMMLGVMATINQELDYDTCELIVAEFGITIEQQLPKTSEEALTEIADEDDDESELVMRPPVVTIMGHVDHGKTSLLDAIRNTSVTAGEAGGITQHIGAYTVRCNDRLITFIDTPGHEAFTAMRARGAQVTDIVILVVAADDGIMPQTIEAINHSKAAGVPIIVAINKIDRETANPDRIKQQLNEQGLLIEDWGGDTICVNVSAKKRIGLENLLEMILLQADVLELRANPNRLAKGTIVEAELDKGKGPIATVLVQNGTLHVGDCVLAGTASGRVRAMLDDKGRRVQTAGPSCPVQITGFSSVPVGGDVMMAAKDEKLLRSVVQERLDKIKAENVVQSAPVTLAALFERISSGQQKELNIIVKADVQGSVEAVKQSLEKLSNEEVKIRCIHGGVGAITSTDIALAAASNAIVIGFNVRPDASARQAIERESVDVRLYSVIYNAIEDIEKAMKGMFAPQFEEVVLGRISVRETIKISGVGTIAGGYVQDGKVQRNAQVRVVRDGIVVHEGKIGSLRRFKDDVREVASGYECGIAIENFNDVVVGDVLEVYIMQEIKR